MAQSVNSASGAFGTAISEFAASLPDRDLFAVMGAVALVLLGFVVLALIVRGLLITSKHLNQVSAARAMAADTTPGNKIMMVRFRGANGRATRHAVTNALEHYLPEFNFGSPFYLGYSATEIEASDFALTRTDFQNLEQIFATSGADLIVWGAADVKEKLQRIYFCTRDMLAGGNPKGFFTLTMTGKPSEWAESEMRAIAYVAGRRLRPSLGRPADFRADRLTPIVEAMEKILLADSVLTGQALSEIESDYTAGALHLGEQFKDTDWLDKSVTRLAAALSTLNPEDNLMRWARAKIDLGRAMCYQCEQKFESAKLQEAMAHIRDGVNASQAGEGRVQAERGVAAMKRAEQILESRRRFSIRWNA